MLVRHFQGLLETIATENISLPITWVTIMGEKSGNSHHHRKAERGWGRKKSPRYSFRFICDNEREARQICSSKLQMITKRCLFRMGLVEINEQKQIARWHGMRKVMVTDKARPQRVTTFQTSGPRTSSQVKSHFQFNDSTQGKLLGVIGIGCEHK